MDTGRLGEPLARPYERDCPSGKMNFLNLSDSHTRQEWLCGGRVILLPADAPGQVEELEAVQVPFPFHRDQTAQ